MARRPLLTVLLVAASTAWAHNNGAPNLDSIISKVMQESAVPAMAVLPIYGFRAGTETVQGVRKIGSADRARRGDRWHLGSNSKAMTATLIARLVEQGHLSWTTRLDEMLPDLAEEMNPAYRDVTLADLLSHRSGLPENVSDEALFKSMYRASKPLVDARLEYVAAALKEPPVVSPHGARSYSNTGYIAAGLIAERTMGRSFEDLMRKEIFAPLDMRTVSFDQRGGPSEPSGHVDGRVADRPDDVNPAIFTPAGGGRMALSDWARFCIDQMQGEHGHGKLLKAETYRFLHSAQGQTNAALGWGVQQELAGRSGPVLTHSGSDGNWYAVVALFPSVGDGVLVVTSAAESMQGDEAVKATLRTFIQAK